MGKMTERSSPRSSAGGIEHAWLTVANQSNCQGIAESAYDGASILKMPDCAFGLDLSADGGGGLPPDQRGSKCGSRFSMKARTPSRPSGESKSLPRAI